MDLGQLLDFITQDTSTQWKNDCFQLYLEKNDYGFEVSINTRNEKILSVNIVVKSKISIHQHEIEIKNISLVEKFIKNCIIRGERNMLLDFQLEDVQYYRNLINIFLHEQQLPPGFKIISEDKKNNEINILIYEEKIQNSHEIKIYNAKEQFLGATIIKTKIYDKTYTYMAGSFLIPFTQTKNYSYLFKNNLVRKIENNTINETEKINQFIENLRQENEYLVGKYVNYHRLSEVLLKKDDLMIKTHKI